MAHLSPVAIYQGSSAALTSALSGPPACGYQWFKDVAAILNETSYGSSVSSGGVYCVTGISSGIYFLKIVVP